MIEKLKNFICKLFNIKQCECVPVYEDEEAVKKNTVMDILDLEKAVKLVRR